MNLPVSASGAKKRYRIGFLSSHPIQYAAPLYAYLNRSADVEPVVLYLTDYSCRGALDKEFGVNVTWDLDLLEGYEHHFIGPRWRTADPYGFFSLRTTAIAGAIRRYKLDALVLHGHQYAANLIALAAARLAGIPIFYKSETHLGLPRSTLKSLLRPVALKCLFAQVSGFLAIGTRNSEFYRSLGVAESRIFHFPYAVDNTRFASSGVAARARRAKLRHSFGLSPELPVILFASKLIPRKHPELLLEACARLAAEGHRLQLLIAGTGDLEETLRARAAALPQLATSFAGFVNQSELPNVFAVSDIFVLPSRAEPWGLIVNEAMSAGLPVVVSREIGCAADLVRDGDNGFAVAAGDVEALAAALRTLLANGALRARMGRRSAEIMASWGFEQNYQGLRAAIAAAVRTDTTC